MNLPFLGLLPLMAAFQPSQEPTVFHSGTRLVEVEVVVRDRPIQPPGVGEWFKGILDSGPPFGPPGALLQGLTKDDFILLDDGKPQSVSVFRAGPSSTEAKPISLPPGVVSNLQDSRGQPLNGATAVLIDLLNTEFDTTEYARQGMIKLLRSLGQNDNRIAVYTLGKNLHILHDFTDDPRKLTDLAAKLDHGPGGLTSALQDFGDLLTLDGDEAAAIASQVHAQMTAKAIQLIANHLSGVPGRKNLVWLIDEPGGWVPPVAASLALALAQRSNIVVYPVILRAVGCFSCPHLELDRERATRDLAAATGGRAFFDAMDLAFAVRAAEEDSRSSYVLGYYPEEEILDGKYHKITVKLRKALNGEGVEVNYRPGYLATKVAVLPPAPTPEELFAGTVNSARIGLAAQAVPDAEHPGSYEVHVTVDLHDIRLEPKDGHFTGGFDLSVPKPASKGVVYTSSIAVDLMDKELADALENGFTVVVKGAEAESGEIRVVVRDRATGIAGSLRVPVENPSSK
jgi:VWFA-related protein